MLIKLIGAPNRFGKSAIACARFLFVFRKSFSMEMLNST